jgi:signal-transduction protein with cAMP-binding, CBS, and nucleotidyltransferase domain
MGEIMRLITSILLVLLPIMGMAQNTEPVFVEKVVNSVQIGPLTGNKNLAFGVKNILQELVQENHPLMETIDENTIVLKTEIVFFDILTTKKNIS